MDTTPITLLQRLRRPNQQAAWSRFVELYTPLLYTWARRTGLQESDAGDFVQEVFAHLVTKLPEFDYDPKKSFRRWLHTVAANQWRASLRRQRPVRPATEQALANLSAPESTAFWENDYRKLLVARAMRIMQAEFQPETWKACWECVVHDRSAIDVGKELGMSAGAVRAAKFRVMARLRRELDGLWE